MHISKFPVPAFVFKNADLISGTFTRVNIVRDHFWTPDTLMLNSGDILDLEGETGLVLGPNIGNFYFFSFRSHDIYEIRSREFMEGQIRTLIKCPSTVIYGQEMFSFYAGAASVNHMVPTINYQPYCWAYDPELFDRIGMLAQLIKTINEEIQQNLSLSNGYYHDFFEFIGPDEIRTGNQANSYDENVIFFDLGQLCLTYGLGSVEEKFIEFNKTFATEIARRTGDESLVILASGESLDTQVQNIYSNLKQSIQPLASFGNIGANNISASSIPSDFKTIKTVEDLSPAKRDTFLRIASGALTATNTSIHSPHYGVTNLGRMITPGSLSEPSDMTAEPPGTVNLEQSSEEEETFLHQLKPQATFIS